MKIIVTHVHPPIPLRTFDYSAHVDGEDESTAGWGPTPISAIRDLCDQLEEKENPK